jgi:hypothetical protein
VITKTDLVDSDALARLQQRLLHQLEHHAENQPMQKISVLDEVRVLTSAHADLTAEQMLQALPAAASRASAAIVAGHAEASEHVPAHADKHDPARGQHPLHDAAHNHGDAHQSAGHTNHPLHAHAHAHSAQAHWWALPGTVASAQLLAQIQNLQGRVRTEQGACVLQMAPFESAPTVQADTLALDANQATGLTLIVAQPLQPAQRQVLDAVLSNA